MEKTKEADEGSRYAQQQYEKYHTAYAAARTVSEGIARSNAAEMGDLLDERDLIKEIMRMIGTAQIEARNASRLISFRVHRFPSMRRIPSCRTTGRRACEIVFHAMLHRIPLHAPAGAAPAPFLVAVTHRAMRQRACDVKPAACRF